MTPVNFVPTHHINMHPVLRRGRGYISAVDGSPVTGRPERIELVGGIDAAAYTSDTMYDFVRGALSDETVVAVRVVNGRAFIYGLPVPADEIEEPDYEVCDD